MATSSSPSATLELHATWLDRSLQGPLAELAFGARSAPEGARGFSRSSHLAFLTPAALELDLSDPAERDFGDYELLELLGQGGMGVVYRARQHSLDRDVALKLLSAGPWASADFIERFRREAQSAARLQHPNIVAVHEIGSREGLNFFSMALVRGPSLASVLDERTALAPREAATLLRTIAEALDYAHRLGVLHLDLKPGNVLIDEHGEPLVADFGLARRLDDTLAADTDEISGTPSYMAPEQAQLRSHKLSVATDIYGLGAILYECLTGRPPLLGATPQETLKLVVSREPVRPRDHVPGLSPDIEAIALKCLAKAPGERYRSARQLADDLDRFLDGRAVSVRPLTRVERIVRWARREPRVAGATAAAVFALVAGLVATTTQWRRAESNAIESRAAEAAARGAQLESQRQSWSARRETAFRYSLEGRGFDALPGLYANLVEAKRARDDRSASHDETFIAAILNTYPRLIDVVPLGAPIGGVAASDDGAFVAVATDDGVVHGIDAATGEVRWRTTAWARESLASLGVLPGLGEFDPSQARFVFDVRAYGHNGQIRSGRGMLMRVLDARTGTMWSPPGGLGGEHGNWVVNAQATIAFAHGPRVTPLALPGFDALGPSWAGTRVSKLSPDGRHYASLHLRTGVELRDARTGRLRATFPRSRNALFLHVAFSPDSRWLATGTSTGDVVYADTRTGELHRPDGTPRARIVSLAFSEDGAWLGAGTGSQSTARLHLWNTLTRAPVVDPIPVGSGSEEFWGLLLDRKAGLAFAMLTNERVALFRLPKREPFGYGSDAMFRSDAAQAIGQLSHAGGLVSTAVAWSRASSVLFTGGRDGTLRMWRIPAPATIGPAPPAAFANLEFDGAHVPVVSGRDVTVVDVATRRAAASPLRHAQPVQYAQLTQDSRALVTAAAREVTVWDWRAGTPLGAPRRIDATPVRLAINSARREVIVFHGRVAGGKYREAVEVFGLDGNGERSARTELDGPIDRTALRADGSELALLRGVEVVVLDAATLSTRRTVRIDPSHPDTRIADFAIAPDGAIAAITTVGVGSIANDALAAQLQFWPRGANPAARTVAVPYVSRLVLGPNGTTIAAQLANTGGKTAVLADLATPAIQAVHVHGAEFFPGPAMAFHPSGTRVARGGFSNLLLTDAASDAPVSPLLAMSGHFERFDPPARLAWNADGTRLLAMTRAQPQWLSWDFSLVPRDLAELGTLVDVLQTQGRSIGSGEIPAIRAALRRDDRSPSSDAFARVRAHGVEPRSPELPPDLLDLSAHYNAPTVGRFGWPDNFELGVLPLGVQRFDGTDFDVRGIVGLVARNPWTNPAGRPDRIEGLRVGGPVQAVRLLVAMGSPWRKDGLLAHVDFAYRDGTRASMPLVANRDMGWILGVTTAPTAAKVAPPVWTGRNRSGEIDSEGAPVHVALYAPRIKNPHPDRELATLSIRMAADSPAGIWLFGITVEGAQLTTDNDRRGARR